MIPFPSLAPLANSPPPNNNNNTSRKNRSMSALRSLSPSTTTSNNTSSSTTASTSTTPPPPPARERSKSDSSTSVLHTPSNDNTNTRSSLDSPHPLQQQHTNPSINVQPPRTPSNSISQSPSSQQLQSSALAKGLIAASVTGVVPPLVASPISSPTFSPSSNNSASQSPSHTRPSTAEPEKQTLNNSTVTATNASPQQIQQLLQTIQDANENSFSGNENGTSPARAATINVAGGGFPTLGRANKSVENLPRPTEGVGVIPLVAKQSKNQQFHSIFRSVPDQEFLIEDFSCALQKEILVQGRLYVSENHICFHASILGWITTVMVPFSDVIAIEKRVTALIFPNAIEVITERQKYFFASFIFRELAFNLLTSLWRKANPAAALRTQTLPANLSHPLHSKDEFDSDPGVENGDKSRKRDASRSKSRHRSKSRSRRNTEEGGKANETDQRGRSAGKRQRRRRSYSDPSDNEDDVSDGSTTGSESDSRTGQSYDSQSIYSTEGSASETEDEDDEDSSYISLRGSGSASDNELEDEEVSVSGGEASSGGYKTESESDFASDGDQDASNSGVKNRSKLEKGKSNSDSSIYSLSAVGANLKLNSLNHSHTAHSSSSSLEQASPPPQFHSHPHRHRHPRTNSHSRFHSDSGAAPSTAANGRLRAITHDDGVKDVSVSDSGYSYVAKTLVKSESRSLGHGRSKSGGTAVEAGLKGGSENEAHSGNANQTHDPTDNTLHPIPTTKPRSGTLPSSFPPSSTVLTTSPQELHGDVEEVPLVFKSPVPCDPKCYCPSNVPVTIVMEEVVEGVTVKDVWELVYRDESLCLDYQESDETGMKEGKGFLKRFLEKKQGLKEIEPTKWESLDDGKKVRKLKYLMPLAYPIGPKQTKVLYSEEVVEMDLESKLIIRATSQTPDVPAGTSFSTITIIGVTYTTPTSIKLTVATYVAWTKSSWFKSTVESGAVEGNTKYYKNLVAELRMWIKQYGRSIPVADGKNVVHDRRTRKQTKETETEEGEDRINRKSRRRRNDLKSTSKRKRTKSVTSPTTTSPETSPHPLLSTILGSFQSYLFPSSTTPQIPQSSPPKTKSRRKSSNSKDPTAQKSPKSSTHRSKSSKTKRKSSTSTPSPPTTILQSLQSMTLQNILNLFLLFLIIGNIWVGVWMWKVSTLLDNVVQELEKPEIRHSGVGDGETKMSFRHRENIQNRDQVYSNSESRTESGTVTNGNESLNSNSDTGNTSPIEPQSSIVNIVNEVLEVKLQQNDHGGNGINVNDGRSGEVRRSEL